MTDERKEFPDPLVDDVRERRRQLWADFDNDWTQVYRAIQRLQAEHPEKVFDRRKSKPAVPMQ